MVCLKEQLQLRVKSETLAFYSSTSTNVIYKFIFANFFPTNSCFYLEDTNKDRAINEEIKKASLPITDG